jgi:hypothetical protein
MQHFSPTKDNVKESSPLKDNKNQKLIIAESPKSTEKKKRGRKPSKVNKTNSKSSTFDLNKNNNTEKCHRHKKFIKVTF